MELLGSGNAYERGYLVVGRLSARQSLVGVLVVLAFMAARAQALSYTPSCPKTVVPYPHLKAALPAISDEDFLFGDLVPDAVDKVRELDMAAAVADIPDALLSLLISRMLATNSPIEAMICAGCAAVNLSDIPIELIATAVHEVAQRSDGASPALIDVRHAMLNILLERFLEQLGRHEERVPPPPPKRFAKRFELTDEDAALLGNLFDRESFRGGRYWDAFMTQLSTQASGVYKSVLRNLLMLARGEKPTHSSFLRDSIHEIWVPHSNLRIFYAMDGAQPKLISASVQAKSGGDFHNLRQQRMITHAIETWRAYNAQLAKQR